MTHEQAAGASRWRMYVVWALWLPVWSGEGDWSLHGTKRRAVEIWNIVYRFVALFTWGGVAFTCTLSFVRTATDFRWSDGLSVTLDKSEEDPIVGNLFD
ncbi:hypothetical protein PC110_g13730 [Phytophthora cactorum]|uniref:Uncharacterized protein n=1 Tax=Phytophthora cactorum TaxID=29920 RepID=A0A329S2W3_9STRA|nr:hypothetical protein PC110_g13730 [Phytophthora cactorum]